MITLLSGTLVTKESDRVVVMTTGGVGYECLVPTRSLEQLPSEGRPVELHTHLAVREDALTLFGFASADERQVFQRLITASGVGPKMALGILSQLSAQRVVRAIRENDLAALTSVSGVGKKTAERLILELKDKTGDLKSEAASGAGSLGGTADIAIKALIKLGYTAAEADGAVRASLAASGRQESPELVKDALRHLAGR